MTSTEHSQRIVTIAELAKRSSLSVATIYRLMPEHLARPKKISPGRVGWSASYIDAWLSERVDGSATQQASA